MRKLLFVLGTMETGGIQTALCNLLDELVKTEMYEIDLLLFDPAGKCMKRIPKEVKIRRAGKLVRLLAIPQQQAVEENRWTAMLRLLLGGVAKVCSCEYAYQFLLLFEHKTKKYDVAIAYLPPGPQHSLFGGCAEYVLTKAQAPLKIDFVHCDVVQANQTSAYCHKVFKKFDRIGIVSNSCKKLFDTAFPDLANKSFTVYNCYNYQEISNQTGNLKVAEIGTEDICQIVTVSRITDSKGLNRLAQALGKMQVDGITFMWQIIGTGSKKDIENLKSAIDAAGISTRTKLRGEVEHPYTIVAQADLLVITSYHEAAPMVIREANAVGVPVLSTKTSSADEFIEHGKTGYVCENNDDEIYASLKEVVQMKLYETYKKNLASMRYDNELALTQFNMIVGE